MTKYILAAVLLTLTIRFLPAADVQLEVRAGGHDRENCPVVFPLPAELADTGNLSLVRLSDGKPIAVQRFGPAKSRKIMWMIHDRLKSGERRRYQLTAVAQQPTQGDVVRCEDDGAKLWLSIGSAPVLAFNHAIVEPPEGIAKVYRRSGYVHPVFTPQGNVVTGDFERDHPHQHGIFNAWVNTTFRGKPADFWNQAKAHGDVQFSRFKGRQVSGPVFAQFQAELSHVAIDSGQRTPAMTETMQVRVFNAKPFLFEITSRQTPATGDAIEVNDYHYGGFGIRGPSEWLAPGAVAGTVAESDPAARGDFLTSSHRTRADGNHTRARWVEMHGPIGSQHAGIVVLGAPNNFRSPQTVRLHPSKPYFCFAPMVLGAFKLEPGDTLVSRYRYVVHDGGPNAELAERMWQDFAHPPKVSRLK